MKKEMNTNSRGYEIDFRDLLARLFDKWVIVLVFLLIGAAVGCLIGVRNNSEQTEHQVTQEDVDRARETLAPDRAEHVEYLYDQYVSANHYRSSLERYLTDSLYSENELNDSMIQLSLYYVDSSTFSGAEKVLELLALDLSDCEKIAQILGSRSDSFDDVYRRVCVTEVNTSKVLDPALLSEEAGYALQRDSLLQKNDHLLQVWVVADTKEQAEQITEVVEESLERSVQELQKIDGEMTLTCIGQKYSTDVYEFFQERQINSSDDLHNSSYQIYRLENDYIAQLAPEEQAFIELLKARDSDYVISASTVSLKKLTAIGALIGLIVGAVMVILQYLLNGRLKNAKELSERYQVEVPYVIYRKKKGFHLFGHLTRKLIRADLSDESIRQKMAASDMAIKLEKTGYRSVCLVCDRASTEEEQLARTLLQDLRDKNRELSIELCNPLSGVEELETFSASDAVIIVTQLKKTKLIVAEKWVMLSERYGLPIVGAVALEEC